MAAAARIALPITPVLSTLSGLMTTFKTARSKPRKVGGLISWLCLALLTIIAPGCRLGQPASARFASVVIANKSPEQIAEATAQVFRQDGYAAFQAGPGQMVFQKQGSKLNDIGQYGMVDSYYGATTMIRVRAEIVDLGTGSFRLQGQAYMVRNAGDSFFEDEHPLIYARRGPYQRLFDKVAKQLKAG
jgi:hypothetical protein